MIHSVFTLTLSYNTSIWNSVFFMTQLTLSHIIKYPSKKKINLQRTKLYGLFIHIFFYKTDQKNLTANYIKLSILNDYNYFLSRIFKSES